MIPMWVVPDGAVQWGRRKNGRPRMVNGADLRRLRSDCLSLGNVEGRNRKKKKKNRKRWPEGAVEKRGGR